MCAVVVTLLAAAVDERARLTVGRKIMYNVITSVTERGKCRGRMCHAGNISSARAIVSSLRITGMSDGVYLILLLAVHKANLRLFWISRYLRDVLCWGCCC